MTNSRLSNKKEMSMEAIVKILINEMKIASGLNEQLIVSAWDAVSDASAYTVSRYVRNDILFCSISSSVVRSRLYLRKNIILEKINDRLLKEELFVENDKKVGLLKDIILR